jgi:hypothetical protein
MKEGCTYLNNFQAFRIWVEIILKVFNNTWSPPLVKRDMSISKKWPISQVGPIKKPKIVVIWSHVATRGIVVNFWYLATFMPCLRIARCSRLCLHDHVFICIESNGLWLLDNRWLFILNYAGVYIIKLIYNSLGGVNLWVT